MNDTDNTNYTITTQPISQIETDQLIELVRRDSDWAWQCERLSEQLAERDAKIAALEMALDNIANAQEAVTKGEATTAKPAT